MERVELRRAALERLVRFENPEAAREELAGFNWDSGELVDLSAEHVSAVLVRYLARAITPAQVEKWANSLECRDDLSIPRGPVLEAVFDLANPVIRGELTRERATALLDRLSAGV